MSEMCINIEFSMEVVAVFEAGVNIAWLGGGLIDWSEPVYKNDVKL